MKSKTLNLSKISNITCEDVERVDYPDFSNSWISAADYGKRPMSEDELGILNDKYPDYVYEKVIESLY